MRQIVKVIPRNDSEEIRVSLTSYKDQEYVDLRVYFHSANGEWLPTKKGVTFRRKLAKAVREALKGI